MAAAETARTDPALWTRLRTYRFPMAGTRHGLYEALKVDLGMTAARAKVAVEEYRKLLYLAAATGERVVPSPFLDRVWQEHLRDARAYETMLAEVTRKPINPPAGCPSAVDPGDLRTLALYRREFGVLPFPPVWPSRRTLMMRRIAQGMFFATLAIGGLAGGSSWVSVLAFLAAFIFVVLWYRLGPWEAEHSAEVTEEPEKDPA